MKQHVRAKRNTKSDHERIRAVRIRSDTDIVTPIHDIGFLWDTCEIRPTNLN